MKNYLALLGLLTAFLPTMGTAQILNPATGYVITTNGDTLTGIINLDNEALLSRGVHWQGTVDAENSSFFKPTELLEFGITESGRLYRPITHTYTLDDDSTKQVATRLARVLYDGPLQLFHLGVPTEEFYKVLADVPPWVYYIKTEEGQFIKLEVVEKAINSSMGTLYEKYRGPLKYLMRDWPQATARIDKTSFRDEDLVRLLRDYIEFKYPEAVGGESLSTRRVTKLSHYAYVGLGGWTGDYEASELLNIAYGGGYMLKWYNPYVDNSFEVGVGLEFLNLNYLEAEEDQTIRVFEGWMLRLPISAEFYLTKRSGNIQPRLRGIILASYIQRKGESLRTELVRMNGQLQQVPIGYFPFTSNSVSIHFAGGVGLDLYKRYRLDVLYEKNLGFLLQVGAKLN